MPGTFAGFSDRVSALTGRTRYPLMLPFPLRRRDGLVGGLDPVVGLGHLLSRGVVRHQRFDDRRRRQTADGESLDAVQKVAAADLAVDVTVVQVDRFAGSFFLCSIETSL